jgi:flagellar basal-body rod modification protein FlgD
MATINPLANIPGGLTPSSTQSKPSSNIDQEGFLQLLVAQLQNQDPLEPLSNEEFVSQLTAFSSLDELREIKQGVSGLEELQNLTDLMGANLALQQAAVNASTVSLIGTEVEAVSNTVNIGDSENTEIGFTLPDSSTSSVTLTLESESGDVIYTTQFNPTNPPDGVRVVGNRVYIEVPTESETGAALPEGTARIKVTASTSSGEEALTTTLLGEVDGIDFRGEETMITVGGTPISLVNVLAVNRIQE